MTETGIEAFLMVVKTGNLTTAAERLYITQPALSRRLEVLEKELGYSLIVRGKGVRKMELTKEGEKFIQIAGKWQALLKDAREIASMQKPVLHIASIESISAYLLPQVMTSLLKEHPKCNLYFHQYHSEEAYQLMEAGEMDVAIISDDRYSRTIQTVPLFREKMVLVARRELALPDKVTPSMLNVEEEIRLPWYPEFELWHDYWFGKENKSKVNLDKMTMMEKFIKEVGSWAVVPYSVAQSMNPGSELNIHELVTQPPERIIYYLTGRTERTEEINCFLRILREQASKFADITML